MKTRSIIYPLTILSERSDIRSPFSPAHPYMLSLPGKTGFRFPLPVLTPDKVLWPRRDNVSNNDRTAGLKEVYGDLANNRALLDRVTQSQRLKSWSGSVCLQFFCAVRTMRYLLKLLCLSRLSVSEMSPILISIFQGARVTEHSS